MKTSNELLILQKKAQRYFKLKIPIHITFKREGEWENGLITENPTADFFRLEYLKIGKEKHQRKGDFIFFLEIKNIEEYSDVKNAD